MPMNFSSYNRLFVLCLIAVIVLSAAVNLVVDPYSIYRIAEVKRFNAIKPKAETHIRIVKSYGIRFVHPRGIVLGNSRADIGIDPLCPAWPEDARPVYNLAIPGDVLVEHYKYLVYANAVSPLHTVVVGLDYQDFPVDPDASEPPPDASGRSARLARLADPGIIHRLLQRSGDLATSLFSVTALLDSGTTVLMQNAENPSHITTFGFNPLWYYNNYVRNEGHFLIFKQKRDELARRFASMPRNLYVRGTHTSSNFTALEKILRFCRENDIGLYLYVHPYHRQFNEVLEDTGHGSLFDAWKQEIAHIVARYSDGKWSACLWDFSGENSVTTEPVPAENDRKTKMAWYWELGHYKKETGDLILARIFGYEKTDVPEDFGVRLFPATGSGRN